jgi:hypothetical protein
MTEKVGHRLRQTFLSEAPKKWATLFLNDLRTSYEHRSAKESLLKGKDQYT